MKRVTKTLEWVGWKVVIGKKGEPKDVEPKDVEPKDVEPKDVEPKDVEPKDVEPKDVENLFLRKREQKEQKKGVRHRVVGCPPRTKKRRIFRNKRGGCGDC
jgi:hypothetical protein